jgi:heme/copper-type cytochrome/quinol oxidase subunit 2
MDKMFGKNSGKSQKYIEKQIDRFGEFFEYLGSSRNFVFHLWIPTLSGIISFILFGFIGQSIEIYHSLILDRGDIQIFWVTLNIFWLSFFTWQSARLLADKPGSSNKDKTRFWICLIGLLPFLGLIFGIYQSNYFQDSNDRDYAIRWMGVCIILLLVTGILFWNKVKKSISNRDSDGLFSKIHENIIMNIILMWFSILTIPITTAISGVLSFGVVMVFATCIFFNSILFCWSYNEKNTDDRKNDTGILWVCFIINILVAVGSTFLPPLLISKQFGAISVAAVSISSLTVIFSTIYNWGWNSKIPSVSLLIIVALISSYFNWNDNHEIRYLRNTNLPTYSSSLENSFKDWFGQRTDLNAFKEKGLKEYPVYVISAQGGGIYAAYHSATALSKLHDTIPNFSDHVFAISSVSGGSLGSSVYSALVKNSQNNPSPLAENASVNKACKELTLCTKAHEIINQDFLSPLFALGLFPDILQRFIPFPRINDWDRSRGLEIALEESWKKALNTDNILAQPYYQFWHPSKRAPALVLNTTTVETGERLLFSPFTIPYSSSKTMLDFKKVEDSNIPLSTAAGLSARFPIVSSAGWFTYEKAGKKYTNRLVDGGYYDNSGLVTARDIVSALSVNQKDKTESVLEELNKTYGIKPKLINLAIVDVPQPTQVVGSSSRGFDGVLSPLTTVLNVRNTRGSGVVAQAAYDLNRDATKPEDYRFRAFYLDKEMAKLPLGWLLSKTSQDAIEKQNPSYETCNDLKMTQLILGMKDKINTIENNSCVAKSIFMELNPKSLIVPQPSKKAK